MNYIYDIFLNLNKHDFDFYDWNIDDQITHIRKTPLIKINTELLYKMINYDFSINEDLSKKISNRTEVFSNKNIKIIKSLCIFSDGKDAIAIKFTNNGKREKISRLLLDEKEEILDVACHVEETKIEINVGKPLLNDSFKTREEQDIYYYIKKEFQKKNYDKLKYTYFECFNQEEQDYEKIINQLTIVLDNNWDMYYGKIYQILKLSSMKKSRN